MGMPGLPELTIILIIVVLLFGAKKIPDLAKGLGSGIKNFKNAIKDDEEATKVATDEGKKINPNEEAKPSETVVKAATEAAKPAETVKPTETTTKV